MHVRVCRDCGEEYRPGIAVCADCGGELEDRWEDEEGAPTGPPPLPPEPRPDLSGHRAVFVTSHAAQLLPLAERLREAGLAFVLNESRKDPRAPVSSFSLMVRDELAGEALRALAPLLGGEADPDYLHAVESAYEAGVGYRRCPACSAELAAAAQECPGCGLILGDSGTPCPRCGAPLGPDDDECPSCGSPVEG